MNTVAQRVRRERESERERKREVCNSENEREREREREREIEREVSRLSLGGSRSLIARVIFTVASRRPKAQRAREVF